MPSRSSQNLAVRTPPKGGQGAVAKKMVGPPIGGVVCGRRFCSRCGKWRLAIDFPCRKWRGPFGMEVAQQLASRCRNCDTVYYREKRGFKPRVTTGTGKSKLVGELSACAHERRKALNRASAQKRREEREGERKKERMAYRNYMYRKALREGRKYVPRPGKHPEELVEWLEMWFGDPELDKSYEVTGLLKWLSELGGVGIGTENKFVVSEGIVRKINSAKKQGQLTGFSIDNICTAVGRPDMTAEFLASLPVVDDTRKGRNLRVVLSRDYQAGTQETPRRAA